MSDTVTMDKLVALAKNRGFVYPGSEIYGGLANAWDYGPYGAALKNNIKKAWWQKFVIESPYNVGIDSAILMNPEVWVASGHVGGFNDPMLDCRSCKRRFRADQLIEDFFEDSGIDESVEGLSNDELAEILADRAIDCPNCGARDFTEIRQFNLMFRVSQGKTDDDRPDLYLRPETAQGIFVNFRNVQRTTRRKIPFGIAQIGKSFRNEITPRNFIFRTREFEQLELEFFCEPGTDLEWFEYWRTFCKDWLLSLGIREDELRLHDHSPEELSFYSVATTDFQFHFPFGWGELWGIADRTDYDLKRHMEYSREDLQYFDPATNRKYIPYVVEPSLGVERMLLAFFCSAYDEEVLPNGETRVVMRFSPVLAPVKIAVLPLSAKLSGPAEELYRDLCRLYECEFDDRQSIGRRYRRQDEIGTPYCVTVDFETLEDQAVTIRSRDSMEQVRVPIKELETWFAGKFDF